MAPTPSVWGSGAGVGGEMLFLLWLEDDIINLWGPQAPLSN